MLIKEINDIPESHKFGRLLFDLAASLELSTVSSRTIPQKVAKAIYDNPKCFKLAAPNGRKFHNVEFTSKDLNAIAKAVNRHMQCNSATDVPSNYLLAYSILFNCSMDYLFGKIDIKCPDLEVLDMSKKLCISYDAITNIRQIARGKIIRVTPSNIKYNKQNQAALNFLLSSSQLEQYVSSLCDFAAALDKEVKPSYFEKQVLSSLKPNVRKAVQNILDECLEESDSPPSADVIKAKNELELAISKDYAEAPSVEDSQREIKIAKYSLFEVHEAIANQLQNPANRKDLIEPIKADASNDLS